MLTKLCRWEQSKSQPMKTLAQWQSADPVKITGIILNADLHRPMTFNEYLDFVAGYGLHERKVVRQNEKTNDAAAIAGSIGDRRLSQNELGCFLAHVRPDHDLSCVGRQTGWVGRLTALRRFGHRSSISKTMKMTPEELEQMNVESNKDAISSMKMLGHVMMAALTLAIICGTLLALSYWIVP